MDKAPERKIRTFRDLVAWQKAVDLAVLAYELTRGFPSEERFGLVSQVRRAAVSVSANVAEGYGRGRLRDYIRHLEIARGSLFELQSHGAVVRRLGWVGEGLDDFDDLAAEVDRVVSGLIRSLKAHEE